MTRTNKKFIRTYVSGYDLSGTSREIGNIGYGFDNEPDAALTDGSKNVVNGQMSVNVDPLNSFLSPGATTGVHELLNTGTGTHTYTIAYGALAAPAQGDIIFSWPMEQAIYQAEGVYANVGWGGPTSTNSLISAGYSCPFGRLLHASGAETAVNTAIGIDDYGAATALGGLFTYHLLSSDGTVTLTAQMAGTNSNGSFANITGATSGSITAAVSPKHGIVALAATESISRYLRWQLAFGTATTATFLIGFNRRIWS